MIHSKIPDGTVETPIVGPTGQPVPWHYSNDHSVDVAMTGMNWDFVKSQHVANLPLSIANCGAPDEVKKMGIGSPVTSAGLLFGVSGEKRNYPIFKFGNISSIPDEKLPMQCCPTCAVSKYLRQWSIAASLVGGNSGSPIFFAPGLLGYPTCPIDHSS